MHLPDWSKSCFSLFWSIALDQNNRDKCYLFILIMSFAVQERYIFASYVFGYQGYYGSLIKHYIPEINLGHTIYNSQLNIYLQSDLFFCSVYFCIVTGRKYSSVIYYHVLFCAVVAYLRVCNVAIAICNAIGFIPWFFGLVWSLNLCKQVCAGSFNSS